MPIPLSGCSGGSVGTGTCFVAALAGCAPAHASRMAGVACSAYHTYAEVCCFSRFIITPVVYHAQSSSNF